MRLTRRKVDAIAALCRDTAQVFLASVVVGPLVSGERDVMIMVMGIIFAGLSAYFGVHLAR